MGFPPPLEALLCTRYFDTRQDENEMLYGRIHGTVVPLKSTGSGGRLFFSLQNLQYILINSMI